MFTFEMPSIFHHLLFSRVRRTVRPLRRYSRRVCGVEHAEYVAEIVHYHGYGGSFWAAPPVRRPLCGGECPSTVPSLSFVTSVESDTFIRDMSFIERLVTSPMSFYRPNAFLQHIRHFEFHLMGGGSRIDRDHGGLFHLDFRGLRACSCRNSEDAAYRQYGDEEVSASPLSERPVS